jgi:hypothetical protein
VDLRNADDWNETPAPGAKQHGVLHDTPLIETHLSVYRLQIQNLDSDRAWLAKKTSAFGLCHTLNARKPAPCMKTASGMHI